MVLDRKSVLAGAGAAGVAVVLVMVLANAAANASWWPFGNKDRPAVTVSLEGAVNCSAPMGDGFGASPATLTLSASGKKQTFPFPFKLQAARAKSIFYRPTFEYYHFPVSIPKDKDKAKVSWTLTCYDQTGAEGDAYEDSFDVDRDGGKRTICADPEEGGLFFAACSGSPREEAAWDCLVGVIVPGSALKVVDAASIVQGDKKKARDVTYEILLEKLVPDRLKKAVGVAFACDLKKILSDEQAVPQPQPTVSKIAQPTREPVKPVATTAAPRPQDPPPAPEPPRPVSAYDNYGSANVVGRAMCRGNPGNAQSTPGGTAAQTFSVPSGVATLSSAMVQIDPDSRVTAHFSLMVNGATVATASAAAAGDTNFSFPAVSVRGGDSVRIAVTFSATYGKIITVYTVGAPGGTFTASNSCSDGAPNVSTSSTGLRAVVSGTT